MLLLQYSLNYIIYYFNTVVYHISNIIHQKSLWLIIQCVGFILYASSMFAVWNRVYIISVYDTLQLVKKQGLFSCILIHEILFLTSSIWGQVSVVWWHQQGFSLWVDLSCRVSWWSRNFFLLIIMVFNPSTEEYTEGDDGLFRISFCCLHIISLLSALANPILYGYYNKARKTFLTVWLFLNYNCRDLERKSTNLSPVRVPM